MKRRAFLKLFIGGVAIAAIPIPNFLLPKQEEQGILPIAIGGTGYGTFDVSGGTLTQKMIEDAAMRSAQNMGKPDMLLMSKKDYKSLAKYFGYKVVYSGDDIVHVRL